MKKKIVLLVIIIIVVLCICYAIQFCKFNKIYNGMKNNYEINNFEYTSESATRKHIIDKKDNVVLQKSYDKKDNNLLHIFTIYYSDDKSYSFNETTKQYEVVDFENIVENTRLYSPFVFNNPNMNFFEKLKLAFITDISKVEKNGVECYYVKTQVDNNDIDFYINCENYLLVNVPDESLDYSNYKLNSVTDEDVKMPNIEEYTLK